MEQNAGAYWNKGLEWFTSKAFIVHNAVIDEIDKSCFFLDLLTVRRLEYFKQQVHLVDGRRVRTLNSSTAIVLGGGKGKKLHVPSSNFGACLFVLWRGYDIEYCGTKWSDFELFVCVSDQLTTYLIRYILDELRDWDELSKQHKIDGKMS